MKLKQKLWDRWQKNQLVLLFFIIILIIAVSGTVAWFAYIHKIQTATLIDMPQIYIEGPEGAESQLIPLGDIDVTSGTSREYVFRIVTKPENRYRVQFAHTTNVPFSYTIYPVSTGVSGNSVTVEGNTYYYDNTNPLAGAYITDNDATHQVTYGSDSNHVQEDAEPRYWQSQVVTQGSNLSYYVLKVSWNGELKNNKETDMVYLTVRLA